MAQYFPEFWFTGLEFGGLGGLRAQLQTGLGTKATRSAMPSWISLGWKMPFGWSTLDPFGGLWGFWPRSWAVWFGLRHRVG